jgi:cytohesin
MKHLLITTIAAVLLVGCGESQPPAVSIHEAASDGNIEAVKQHLEAGADVNVKDTIGLTPLHMAAGDGRKEVAELLIAKGSEVNAKIEGMTPLDIAIELKHTTTADLLRKHGGKSGATDSIHVAAAVGNIEAVKQHLAAGTDVNAKSSFGTPLHSAASKGNKEIVELLIAAGADVNARDDGGDTPLLNATAFGQKEIVELLIGKGAEVNAKNANGETPLDWDKGEIADLLRKHGGKTAQELKAEGK